MHTILEFMGGDHKACDDLFASAEAAVADIASLGFQHVDDFLHVMVRRHRSALGGVTGKAHGDDFAWGYGSLTACYQLDHTTRQGVLGEIIRVKGDLATLQVYEDTSGISVGEDVVSYGLPLSVTLGPGLLAGIFDGIQRPLEKIRLSCGGFIPKGVKFEAIDKERLWEFTPLKEKGDPVEPGDIQRQCGGPR